MNANEYQNKAHVTAKYIESIAVLMAPIYRVVHQAGDPEAVAALEKVRWYLVGSYVISGLTGEAGEIANKFKKIIRGDGTLEGMGSELGDTLWYLAELATILRLTLDDVMTENIDKLRDRDDRDQIKGSGDNR